MMNTPIVDFLKAYEGSDFSRLHMPGHKGTPYLGPESMDITEIKGADELYFAESIIAQSEANAAALFGTGLTLFSTEGSSHCIRSMVMLARQLWAHPGHRPFILAARNAHKSLLFSAAICDLDIEWLYPSTDAQNSIAACQPSTDALKAQLSIYRAKGHLPFAVFITSPDYLGQCADIRSLSEICHSYGCALLVDNAHGAYLHFLPSKSHPMDLGADLCCDSAHKTLPALTGGAYLHVRSGLCSTQQVKNVMAVTGTSSPSYILMASLDLTNQILADHYTERIKETLSTVGAWKEEAIGLGIPVLDSEPLKIVICAARMGLSGTALGEILRKHHAEPEFCDCDYLVCMITPDTKPLDLARLKEALTEAIDLRLTPRPLTPLRLSALSRVCSIREAIFGLQEIVPVRDSIGRVCGSPAVSCPPAVPIAVSGERITQQAADIMLSYEIETVSVLA